MAACRRQCHGSRSANLFPDIHIGTYWSKGSDGNVVHVQGQGQSIGGPGLYCDHWLEPHANVDARNAGGDIFQNLAVCETTRRRAGCCPAEE